MIKGMDLSIQLCQDSVRGLDFPCPENSVFKRGTWENEKGGKRGKGEKEKIQNIREL